MFKFVFNPFFDETEGGDSGANDIKVELNELDSDLALIGDDSGEEEDKDETIEEDAKEDEDNTDDEEDKVDEEVDEAEDEELEKLTRVSYSNVKEKFPTLFKEFPQLKQAFFREQEFTKIFPTVEDATSAAEAVENYEGIKEMVLSGDAGKFLTEVKAASDDSLKDFAESFLPSLYKVDKEVYKEITAPLFTGILSRIYAQGEEDKDENIRNAAMLVNKLIFGTTRIGDVDERPTNGRVSKEEEKLKKQQDDFYGKKYTELFSSVSSKIESSLRSIVAKDLDPTNSMRSGLKKMLVDKILDEVGNQVAADSQHMGRMNNLWAREKRNGFSGSLKDSLKTTYLSRAKTLVPTVRAKIRKEIFESQKSDDSKNKKILDQNKTRVPAGKVAKGASKILSKTDARGKSDMDIIMHGASE